MSKQSNINGRGYEYACITELYHAICLHCAVEIVNNTSLVAAQNAYYSLSENNKNRFSISARAFIETLFDCEPNILCADSSCLKLYIQPDKKGEEGDVRDIVIQRDAIKWEIGLSIKHNNNAIKHNRLSSNNDFGKKWYNIHCSEQYWEQVIPVFDFLKAEHEKRTLFRNLLHKDEDVYKPLIKAFIYEINKQYMLHPQLPRMLVEYILSKFDFYQIESVDKKHITLMRTFNIHSKLNKHSLKEKPKLFVPNVSLPTRILHLDFYPKRKNTAEMVMDKGWSFTFRIHNGDLIATDSLKFDIRTISMPLDVITFKCDWKQQ